jgi:hypothetical protein
LVESISDRREIWAEDILYAAWIGAVSTYYEG